MTRRRVLLLCCLLACFALLLVAVGTHWGPLDDLDHHLGRALYRHGRRHPGEVRFWRAVSSVLHPDVLRIAAAIAAVLLWLRGVTRAAILVVIALGGAAVLEAVVKLAVGRHRPSFGAPLAQASGASFPSGHALTAFVAFGVLVLLVPRLVTVVGAAVPVLLVSYSRLALGVHFLTDVVGAWLLGAAWLVAADSITYALPGARRGPDRLRGR